MLTGHTSPGAQPCQAGCTQICHMDTSLLPPAGWCLLQTEDGLTHLEWHSREDDSAAAAGPEFDEIVFPDEAEWVKVCLDISRCSCAWVDKLAGQLGGCCSAQRNSLAISCAACTLHSLLGASRVWPELAVRQLRHAGNPDSSSSQVMHLQHTPCAARQGAAARVQAAVQGAARQGHLVLVSHTDAAYAIAAPPANVLPVHCHCVHIGVLWQAPTEGTHA